MIIDHEDCAVCEFHEAQGDRVDLIVTATGELVRHVVTVDPDALPQVRASA